MALDNEKLTERPALTNSQDTDIIHVVRGNVSYQKEAQNFNAGSISALDDVGNVNVPAPQTDNYLKWDTNTNKWIANVIQLGDLSDVVIDENTLADGQVIAYDSVNEEWVNVNAGAGSLALDDLTDVNAPSPTDGQALVWDNTNSEWINANVGIDGNGTANYIPLWTSTNEIGDSDIYKDALNNDKYTYIGNFTIGNGGEFKIGDYNQQGDGAYITNNTTSEIEMHIDGGLAMHIDIYKQVGINQPNPSEILDILGDTPNIKINNTAETDSGIIFQDSQTASQSASIKYGSGDNDLKFYNATDERMRIMNNGKVGIGEIAPDTILHVKGGADNEVATFESTDGTSLILFKDNATTIGNVTGIGAVGNEMVMYTNDIERVRITDAGFTGFNTPNANNIAHIKTTTNGRGLTIQRGSTTSGDYADLSFLISTSDATNPNTRIRAKRGNTLTDTDLEFLTDSQTRMWIKGSNGRVGIAHSNPAEMLHVNGNVKGDDFLFNGGKAVSTSTLIEPTGSDQVKNMVSLTQAEYDAGVIAGTIYADTFYIIT